MRGFLTVVIIVVALLLVFAIFKTPPKETAPHAVAKQTDAPATSVTGDAPAVEDASADTVAAAPKQPDATPLEPIVGLRAKPFAEARVATIGSLNAESGYKTEIDLSAWGASILQIRLTDYLESVENQEHLLLLDAPKAPGDGSRVYPYAARTIWINGEAVSLVDQRWELIEPSGPGSYRTTLTREDDAEAKVYNRATYALTIVDAADQPVVELRRSYVIAPDSYHVECDQKIINKTTAPLDIVWEQRAHGDAKPDQASYMGDRRQAASGYFLPEYDPQRTTVLSEHDAWVGRTDYLPEVPVSKPISAAPFWPNDDLDVAELVWFASLNRYFALVTHPAMSEAVTEPSQITPLQKIFPHLQVEVFGQPVKEIVDPRVVTFILRTDSMRLPAGEAADIDVALYAGPRKKDIFKSPQNDMLGLGKLIRYELGCAFCTFQWLAKFLLGFLDVIHVVVRDWAVAIIILVLCVRTCLHPITKKAQVNMMMMGKQMQSLQPELEKLRKRYADDQPKLNTETMKLYREKGVNPAGMLGCAPMFLQMPIWVALYATLFYAIELRQQAGFYGFFQLFGDWSFLSDLSRPDAFITFSATPVHLNFPLLSSLDFSTLNVLPLVWTVVMYFQQKYMTPPAANEQAAQQQKMMRWMMLLFPVFLYSAPSGLTLYILASSVAGMVDSYYVRQHVKEQEERGDFTKPKKPRKPGGFMDRLGKAMEAKQQELAEQQKRAGGGNKNPGKNRKR